MISWRDEREELAEYLGILQRELKTATRNKKAFPFVMVATFLDLFMAECTQSDPAKELEKALEDLKRMGSTRKLRRTVR